MSRGIATIRSTWDRSRQSRAHSLAPLLVIGALATMSAHQVIAQSTAEASSSSAGTLEEIIVIATKRSMDIQDVPISMSALSNQDIVRNRILTLDDLAVNVPSLTFLGNTTTENYLSIRGATTLDDSTGTDQGVSLYIDDIVRTGVADTTPDLYDLDHAEVLKGPQGTLFGRNATGGVVSLYTANPTFAPEAKVEATYGNFNLAELKGVINAPIIDDRLAMRVAVTEHHLDAWVKDPVLGRKLGSEDRQSARGKLLFTPNDDLRALVGAEYQRSHGSRTDWLFGDFQPQLDSPLLFGRDAVSTGAAGSADQQIWGTSARIDWKNALGTLTSISGFRHVDAHDYSFLTADPQNVGSADYTSQDKQFTQEIRLASLDNKKLTWVGGLYYLNSSKSRPIEVVLNVIPGSLLDFVVGPGLTPYLQHVGQNTHTISYAGFGEATYALLDALKLTLGGRYTYETKTGFSASDASGPVIGLNGAAGYQGSWSAFTPRGTLSYQPVSDLLTYITVSRGFQGGGFNTQGSTVASLSTPFKPELVMNYETGFKFTGLEHRLQVNVAAFLDRYTQLQIIAFVPTTFGFSTTNAGAADIKGIEAEIAAVPMRWLNLGVSYSYLSSKFTSYVIDNGPGVPPTDYTNNQVPYVPKHSVTFRGELNFEAPNRGKINVGGDYSYRSATQLDAGNDFAQFILDRTVWHGMINLHASWATAGERLTFVAWCKNLRNIEYTTTASDGAFILVTPGEGSDPNNKVYTIHPNPPRTFGVTLRARF